MIVPRLRSEARGGSSTGASTRYGGSGGSGVYGSKAHHGTNNDPDLRRAIQYSYTSQAVRKWEKRWVIIHETSMRVHKWMPAPAAAPTLASQIVADKTAALENNNENNNNTDQQQEDSQAPQEQQQESISNTTQDTQMMVDEESTSQSSQA